MSKSIIYLFILSFFATKNFAQEKILINDGKGNSAIHMLTSFSGKITDAQDHQHLWSNDNCIYYNLKKKLLIQNHRFFQNNCRCSHDLKRNYYRDVCEEV